MKEKFGKPLYPLTAAQKLHFFYQKYCPKKQVLNIGTSLTIQQSLDFGALKEAVYKAYARVSPCAFVLHRTRTAACISTLLTGRRGRLSSLILPDGRSAMLWIR